MGEFENEARILPHGLDDMKMQVVGIEESLKLFLTEVEEFESLHEEWINWFRLASIEFDECRNFKANDIQEMNSNLDRLQVTIETLNNVKFVSCVGLHLAR